MLENALELHGEMKTLIPFVFIILFFVVLCKNEQKEVAHKKVKLSKPYVMGRDIYNKKRYFALATISDLLLLSF